MTSRQSSKRQSAGRQPRKLPLAWVAGGVLAVVLIVTIVLTLDPGDDAPEEFGTPAVDGQLPVLVDSLTDPTTGQPAPTVDGADFDGTPVTIADDGQAKVVVFLAHWCPHCQNEVPWVTEWLDTEPLPDKVDFYSVATAIDRRQDNWPPSEWLEREGWQPPVIVDDRVSTVANAFGLPAYPYWVFIDTDGNIAGRVSGGLNQTDLQRVVESLAGL